MGKGARLFLEIQFMIMRNLPALCLIFSSFFLIASLPSTSLAFDCAKATTDTEIAICSDANLKQADNRMAARYNDLLDTLDLSSMAILRLSQRSWLKYRDTVCEARVECLLQETDDRRKAMAEESQRVVTQFRFQKGSKNRYQVKLEAQRFGDPVSAGETVFNRKVDSVISKMPFDEVTENQAIGNWDHEVYIHLERNDAFVISGSIFTSEYSGGAHPNSWSSAINVDARTGEVLSAQTLFTKQGLVQLKQECATQIANEKKERGGQPISQTMLELKEYYADALHANVNDMEQWVLEPKQATILFDAYEVGAYVEGAFQCEFSSETLRSISNKPQYFQ